ncbi:aminopeptidase N [Sneathiella marina]|uniref:Aminopeptidase N n=1 Tax=Sneathiella marina TaxID=2950108 RepID=A0ABY4W1T0_9PROT|nr:aminopeptidase N [Sneathiella marina]USG59822.1 aminopeptidase N [Sneathiella marina]
MLETQVQPATIYLKDYKQPDFSIHSIDLVVELGEEVTTVSSSMTIKRMNHQASTLSLNGENLELISIRRNGLVLNDTSYECTDEYLHIPIPKSEEEFTLAIVTRIKPQENTALEGLYKSSGNFCTQCEAEGFRKITYFLDRPDVMSVFSTTIIGDADLYPVMLSNGNKVEEKQLDDGRSYVKWEDPHPKPAYLFALVAGDLACVEDHFTTASGRDVLLQIFVEKGNEDRCNHAMTSLKKSMKWDEEEFGREYDLDVFMIVAVSDFNMGAMENKGLNVFNSKYVLASPQSATDTDYDGIESVIAHEYFHNWTGNRITCRDWFQLTLKEGLTVFRDQQFSADMNSAAVFRIGDVQRLRAAQFPEDAGPLSHPIQPQSYVEINNFYTATVYEKGAEVIRMIHTILGKEKFRNGMDIYFDRHDGQAVTTEEFVKAMEDGSGIDLTQFRRWYVQAGTPVIKVTEGYNPESQQYSLTLEQENPKLAENFLPYHIPVDMSLLDGNGKAIGFTTDTGAKSTGKVLNLTQKKQTFVFNDINSEPTISLFRGFSAPVKLEQNLDNEQLAFLFSRETDLFNRWDAGQRLSSNILLSQVNRHDVGSLQILPQMYLSSIRNILNDRELDPAFAAIALSLPSEQDLAQKMPVVNVDAIHIVRNNALKEIGLKFESDFLQIYKDLRDLKVEGNQPIASNRKFKNTALRFLTATAKEDYFALAAEQYHAAENMTDAMASLFNLGESEGQIRDEIFADFYQKWEADPLVIDKWFTVQAMSSRPTALEDVTNLLSHPAFTMLNPNRVRSLIAAFVSGNPVHFHEKSGKGYQFLFNAIEQLNGTNPQIAARLVTPLGQWRRYDAVRQKLMTDKLEEILDISDLSNDVYEMANKSLHN